MEKSIESIWKEGFQISNSLIAPRISNLYTRKSIDVIDRLERMFKFNIYLLAGFALLFPPVFFVLKMYTLGVGMGTLFAGFAIFTQRILKTFYTIDKGQDSYTYLKSVDSWLTNMMNKILKIYRFVYPGIFLLMVIGLYTWPLADKVMDKLLYHFPDMWLVYGYPGWLMIAEALILAFIIIFTEPIYRLDVKSLYGDIIKQMKNTLEEMEELASPESV
ncbi:hypothetical protein [Reichenbachiella versicolor]|uniref:hypothetical protein n=1 Tax=Reichenbachiella versicolor TaxID=1821036 RepID=UPI000D6E93AE|nr:hypothetical protein [Reichenbachiella versicolor]